MNHRPPRNPITWRPKKDINLITPAVYYQNGMKKLSKEEGYLKENLGRNKMSGSESMQYVESSMEYDFFMLSKNTLLNGIEELEKNNYKFDKNPFKDLDSDFKERFTDDFVKYFEKMGKPEVARLL